MEGTLLSLPGFCSFPVNRRTTMPGRAAKITITERQQEILRRLGNSVTAPSRLRQRAKIIPKHSSWLNQIEVVFGVIMRKVIRRGSFKSVSDLREKLLKFIEYFNRVFAKPFRWTYTGRPLRCKIAA